MESTNKNIAKDYTKKINNYQKGELSFTINITFAADNNSNKELLSY